MDMMAYHRSDDITIDLMAATIDMMTGLPISNIHQMPPLQDEFSGEQLEESRYFSSLKAFAS